MEKVEAANFIEQIINEDLEAGRVREIQTRFPPEPNGYLHIGHVKSMLVNFGTALKYGGKCNLFFDDTNPSKEKTEFVEANGWGIIGRKKCTRPISSTSSINTPKS